MFKLTFFSNRHRAIDHRRPRWNLSYTDMLTGHLKADQHLDISGKSPRSRDEENHGLCLHMMIDLSTVIIVLIFVKA